jgi:S1/P1 Nuclease/HAD superfamily, subfamily IIIB (Acid phosphatase)
MTIRILCIVLMTLFATPSFAWDNLGHMTVAQVAWTLLNSNARTSISQLLRLNPQYDSWTVNVAPDKRDQVSFLLASTWADHIKGDAHYHDDGPSGGNRPPAGPEAGRNVGYVDFDRHKYWHFVDIPYQADKTPTEDASVPNALTQIALFRKTISSSLVSDDIRSYDLVWLLHLVGDIHQPLHATSAFSLSEPHGDNGGNDEKITCGGCQETVLHWFWDDAPGVSDDPDDAIAAAQSLPQPDRRQAANRDESVWANESFELAEQLVYQPPISVAPGPFTLTDEYKARAVEVAKERMAVAGSRLATLLNTAFATKVDPHLGCDKAGLPPTDNFSQPENIDFLKARLLYYRCTAYDNDVADVLKTAREWIGGRASLVEHPAIVLDIDETSLLNWPRIKLDDYAYIPNGTCPGTVGDTCGDLDWQQSGLAEAVKPTLELYKRVRCIDQTGSCTPIEVFFVTGRKQAERNGEMANVWTLRNLETAGYGTVQPDHLYLRDQNGDGSVAEYKSSARADIERKGFRIIANIGDQLSDLALGHAERAFKVPNPFYYIP